MQLLERGVYDAPFLSSGGDRIIVAVNSAGRFVGWLAWRDERSADAVTRALWNLLDEADPLPVLKAI